MAAAASSSPLSLLFFGTLCCLTLALSFPAPGPDRGSCGNACCGILLDTPLVTPVTAKNAVAHSLKSLASVFFYKPVFENNNQPGWADLRQYNVSAAFMAQLGNLQGPMRLVNVNINQNPTSVYIFSISTEGGVFFDGGPDNSTTNAFMVEAISDKLAAFLDIEDISIKLGCGN
jgi:hypothetical protein